MKLNYINESKSKKAVIIKGNPKRVHPDGDLYEKLQEFLVEKGFEVVMDDGKPHTVPDEGADIWIGYSRGADRLRFAPNGIKTIAIGSNLEGSVNHPDDVVDFENPDDFDGLPDEVKKAHSSWHSDIGSRLDDLFKAWS